MPFEGRSLASKHGYVKLLVEVMRILVVRRKAYEDRVELASPKHNRGLEPTKQVDEDKCICILQYIESLMLGGKFACAID